MKCIFPTMDEKARLFECASIGDCLVRTCRTPTMLCAESCLQPAPLWSHHGAKASGMTLMTASQFTSFEQCILSCARQTCMGIHQQSLYLLESKFHTISVKKKWVTRTECEVSSFASWLSSVIQCFYLWHQILYASTTCRFERLPWQAWCAPSCLTQSAIMSAFAYKVFEASKSVTTSFVHSH